MGVFSRKVLPVCAGVCCCFCPGLRARSKKPIKRYNQYLGDIFKAAEVSAMLVLEISQAAPVIERSSLLLEAYQAGSSRTESGAAGPVPRLADSRAHSELVQCGFSKLRY